MRLETLPIFIEIPEYEFDNAFVDRNDVNDTDIDNVTVDFTDIDAVD